MANEEELRPFMEMTLGDAAEDIHFLSADAEEVWAKIDAHDRDEIMRLSRALWTKLMRVLESHGVDTCRDFDLPEASDSPGDTHSEEAGN
jgi:hypothetical protein